MEENVEKSQRDSTLSEILAGDPPPPSYEECIGVLSEDVSEDDTISSTSESESVIVNDQPIRSVIIDNLNMETNAQPSDTYDTSKHLQIEYDPKYQMEDCMDSCFGICACCLVCLSCFEAYGRSL